MWPLKRAHLSHGAVCICGDVAHWKITRYYGVVSKRNWISIWVEFLIGEFILEITFPFNQDHCGEYQQPIAQVGGA